MARSVVFANESTQKSSDGQQAVVKKSAGAKQARRKKLAPITGISRQIVNHLINAAVFGEYPGCCSLDDLAEHFQRQPARFKTTINRLVDAGYVEVVGELAEMIYPTAEALRNQDQSLSQAEAEKIVRGLKRKR